MKPVFKCDYCEFMGTEEDVKKHELICSDNYDRQSCYTCLYKNLKSKDGNLFYECKDGKKIPEGKIIEFCSNYKRKEKTNDNFSAMFDDIFKF